ncbi:MAG: hypothetical protein P4L64_12685 [Caulobacteraceae bacterium]|nr:hypothetical protein [Caulobacteraceae bacterium]
MRGPVALAAAALLSGCVSTDTNSHPRTEAVTSAITQPLADLNLKRKDIPLILQQAAASPYAPPKSPACADLTAAIAELDAVLGADVDTPKVSVKRTQQVRQLAGAAMIDAVSAEATGWMPARGVIRYVSGADAHTKVVAKAVLAGAVRRGYLKGVAVDRGCIPLAPAPPPTPTAAQPQPPPPSGKAPA